MNVYSRAAACLSILVVMTGCASTTVTRRETYQGERLPPPVGTVVYDFASTAADIPPGSQAQLAMPSEPPTPDEVALGRELGSQVAQELVSQIQTMGLPAVRAQGLRRLGSGAVESAGGKAPGTAVPLAVAIATGNPIGLAVSGAAKIQGEMSGRTTIEGAAKRTAKEIADQLRVAFQKQGWI